MVTLLSAPQFVHITGRRLIGTLKDGVHCLLKSIYNARALILTGLLVPYVSCVSRHYVSGCYANAPRPETEIQAGNRIPDRRFSKCMRYE